MRPYFPIRNHDRCNMLLLARLMSPEPKHYGRFLPQDKAALAARILNQVWEAA
jgi:hypothetical protein